MAEALLRHRLEQVGVTATLSSAGLLPGDRPATDHGVATMADRGLDIAGHLSRQVTPELLSAADLVIGMAREHVREVAVIEPEAGPRTFTLKELVRAAEAKGGRHRNETFSEWLDRLAARRRHDDMVGVGYDATYDVEDPIGRSRADYEATADELDDLLARLVALAWPAPTLQHGQERSA